MLTSVREGRQLCLFENLEAATQLDELLWCRSFDRQESTLHQLSIYAHRMPSSMAQALIDLYSRPGDIVLDPFSGSGVVPFEAAVSERCAWANDLNPYAHTLTRGKLEAPRSERAALQQAMPLLDAIEQQATTVNLEDVPAWVQDFFHPDTLREVIAAFQVLQQQRNCFFMACLLGILHHIRPGFLSYPTNPQAPYLRRVTYPPEQFPQLYAYRDLRSRLIAKIRRVYRRHQLPKLWEQRQYQVWQATSLELPIADNAVDAIVCSPPYPNAFDYVRDHRLRLWFLDQTHWKELDAALISSSKSYLAQMQACLQEMARVLKPDRYCVLVVGDVEQHGKLQGTAERLADLASQGPQAQFAVETLYDVYLPHIRRTHHSLRAIKFERILVLRKRM